MNVDGYSREECITNFVVKELSNAPKDDDDILSTSFMRVADSYMKIPHIQRPEAPENCNR